MVRVLVPSGALGLNYDRDALARGLEQNPDIIAIDGGSTDSGPAYLGRGVSKYSRTSTAFEWKGLMQARAQAGIPLLIGTAGTCGTDSAVDWFVSITREIAHELGQSLRIAVLRSSQPVDRIVQAFGQGRLAALPNAPEISERTLRECTNIVALAGAEQIAAALETGADIIIAGRATDTAVIAALPLMRGLDAGAAWHGAKIGECGALCATNPRSGVVLIEFDNAGFSVVPMAESSRATPRTVSAHMLYENADPFILHEPGGHLDVTRAEYVALDERRVRVTGSRWVPSDTYAVKLEGARPAGYQVVSLVLLRDRRYVAGATEWAADLRASCCAKVEERLSLSASDYFLELRLMGKNASFGPLETGSSDPLEIGVLAIVTAPSAELALEIARILNPYLLHHPLTSQEEQPTFAFPFSPPELERGEIFAFCLHHTLELSDPMEVFSLEVIEHG